LIATTWWTKWNNFSKKIQLSNKKIYSSSNKSCSAKFKYRIWHL